MAATDPTLTTGDVSALCAKAEQAARGAYPSNDSTQQSVQMYFNTFCGAAAAELSKAEGNGPVAPDTTTIAVARHNCFQNFVQLASYLKFGSDNASPSATSTGGTYLAYNVTTGILTLGNANYVCGTDEDPAAPANGPIPADSSLG